MAIESWRTVWRDGLAPLLSDAHLAVLRQALLTDDVRLIRGNTTAPAIFLDSPHAVEGACLIGFCGWQVDGLKTVGEVRKFFDKITEAVNARLEERPGELTSCSNLLNTFDGNPRAEMRRMLLPEVERSIALRAQPISETTKE